MIQITLTTALFLYGAAIICGLAMLYVISELRAKHVYRILEKQFLWRCAFCGYLYLDEDALSISQCPRCESLNTVGDAQDKAVSVARQRVLSNEPAAVNQNDEEVPRRNPSHKKRRQSHRGPRRRR